MKKQVLLISAQIALAMTALAQTEGLPTNPVPGKCYSWSVSEPQFEATEKRVLVRPAYTTLEKTPAVYKTIEERVLVKEASKKYIAYPAEYKTVADTILVEGPNAEISILPTKLGTKPGNIEVRPKVTTAEWLSMQENCQSKDPRDCMVLSYVEHPAEYRNLNYQFVESNASYSKTPRNGKTMVINRQVVVKEARYDVIDVPAEYMTITKRVLVKEEGVVEKEVPAEYAIVTVHSLKDPGGAIKWEEIDCALTDNHELPINFEAGSARLTEAARNILDGKLVKLMKDKPNIRIEISSHTDSKGVADANQKLSQDRAASVMNYLVSRGISRNRLVAKGYGESKLKNRCADGINCTEAEHAQNRRTEYRVIGN